MRVWLALVVGLAVPGCLRTRIDRCAEIPPHPECAALDAGRDAPADAPVDDAVPADSPTEDAAAAADAGPG